MLKMACFPVLFSEMSGAEVKKLVKSDFINSSRSWLQSIWSVKERCGDHPHLRYLEAMCCLQAECIRRDRRIKKREHEERQALWLNGGREAHYFKKFGKFGGHHEWLLKRLERLTGMETREREVDPIWGEEVFDVEHDEWGQPIPDYVAPPPRTIWCDACGGELWADHLCPQMLREVAAREAAWRAEELVRKQRKERVKPLKMLLRTLIKRLTDLRRKLIFRGLPFYTGLPVVKQHSPGAVWQMGDEDEHGAGTTTVTQVSNVVVTEQHGASVAAEPVARSLISYVSGDLVNRYDELVSRPYVYKVGSWTSAHGFNKELEAIRLPIDFVKSIAGSPNSVPFTVHRYCRSDMVVRVQLNANKFMMGQLQMAWYYQDSVDLHFSKRNNVASNSQTLHCLINAGTSNEGVLRIPYRYFKPMMEVGKREDKVEPLDLGCLYLRVLNPLQVTSSSATSCAYTIFVSFENAEFTGMRHSTGNNPLISNSPHARPQMDIAAGIVASRVLSSVLDGNRDKPTTSARPTYFAPQTAQSWCIGNGESEDAYSLRLAHAQVPHPSSYVDDPFTVQSVCSRFGYVKKFTWSSSHASGSKVMAIPAIPMGPEEQYYKQETGGVNTFVLPPVAFLSNMFAYWRGSLRLRLDFVATQMHTGRLLIGYVPGDYIDDMPLARLYASTYAEFDLKEQQQIEYRIPYVADRMYWDRFLNLSIRGSDVRAPGYVYIYVLAPLAVMDSIAPSIDINMYIAGGDDFELAVPAQPTVGLSFFPVRIIPTSAEAYPIEGSYGFYVGTYTHLDINDRKDISDGQYFAILRYGPLYEHVSQFFMPKKPNYTKPISYYLKLKNYATDGWSVRNPTKETSVKPEFFIPWYDGDYVYVLPCRSEEVAKEWCQRMNRHHGDFNAFLSATCRPDKFFFVYPKGDDDDPYVDTDGHFRWVVMAESGKYPTSPINNEIARAFYPQEGTDSLMFSAHHQMDNRLSVDGVNLSGTSSVANCGSMYFGEVFSDLKDYMRRYQPYCIMSVSKDDLAKFRPGAVIFSFPVLPQGLQLEVGSEDIPFWFQNYAREGPIPLLLSGYRYFRGSLRFRIIFPDSDAIWFVQHIPNGRWHDSLVWQRKTTDYSLGLEHMINHSYAYTVQQGSINRVISFEVPFYLPYDACILQRFDQNKIRHTDLMSAATLGEIRVGLLSLGALKDTEAYPVIQVAYSFGDDARPSTFQGFPPVLLNQDIPLKATPQGLGDYFGAAKTMVSVADEIKRLDINRTVEKTEEALESIAEGSKVFGSAMVKLDDFTTKSSEAFDLFMQNLKASQAPQVILQALSQIAHVINNPTSSTMSISIISFLSSLGIVATSQFGELFSLLTRIFRAFQPQQQDGSEGNAVPQIDAEDSVAFASVLFAGISSGLNMRDVKASKYSKGLALDLVNGITAGCKDGSFFFRFLTNVVQVIIKIFNYCKDKLCPLTLGLENMVDDGEVIKRWAEECIFLTDTTLEPMFDVVPTLTERVHACYIIGSLIYTKLTCAPKGVNIAVLKDLYQKIVVLKTQLADKGLCSAVRREPFVIAMYGAPGIGKSHMASMTILKLLRDANIKYDTSPIYSHPAGAKYWENVNQEPAMLMDDTFVLRTGETANEEVATMMSLKSCALFTPPIAACDRKKKRYAPELVYYHTNVLFPSLSMMECAEAVYRRRDLLWRAAFKEGTTMADYTAEELDACDHLRFALHRAPHDKDRADDWSEWMDYETFYNITVESFKSFRLRQIATHTKKVEFLTAAVHEIDSYPELNRMPLLDVLKLYTSGNYFSDSALFRNETVQLVAKAQGAGDIFLKYLSDMSISQKDREELKNFFDLSIIKEVRSLVEHIAKGAPQFVIPPTTYKYIASICRTSLWCQISLELGVHTDDSQHKLLCCWLEAYEKEGKHLLPHTSSNSVLVEDVIKPCAEAEEKAEEQGEDWLSQIKYEGEPVDSKLYTVDSVKRFYASNTRTKLCCYHIDKLEKYLKLDEHVEGQQVMVSFGITCTFSKDRFISQLVSIGCPHFFSFLRPSFVKVLSNICCMHETNVAHWCALNTTCGSEECMLDDFVPVLDEWTDCCKGSKCFRFSKQLREMYSRIYAWGHPNIVAEMAMDGPSCPQFFRPITVKDRLAIVRPLIVDSLKAIRQWTDTCLDKIWGAMRVVKDFFLQHGKWLLGALAVVGAGFALYHRQPICEAVRDVKDNKIPEMKEKLYDFGKKICRQRAMLSGATPEFAEYLYPRSAVDLDASEAIDKSLLGEHQVMASGDQKNAAAANRVSFIAKTISQASAIMPTARPQMNHEDVIVDRICRNTISIVAFKVDETGKPSVSQSKYARALALGDRYVLTNLHCLELFDHFKYTYWRIFIADRVCEVNMNDVRWVKCDDSTLAIMRMPANFPQFKQIVKYFASEADHTFRRPTEGQLISINTKGVTYKNCKISVRHQVLSIDGMEGIAPCEIANLYEYDAQAPGMCGSLLLAPKLNCPIIGMHIAGLPECNIGFAEPLFKETFSVLFEGIITDLVEPEFLPVSLARMDLQTTVFPLGSVGSRMAQRQSVKTGIVQSAIYGFVQPKTAPAPLVASDPRLPPNSSPLVKGCEKHGIVTKNFSPDVMQRTRERLLTHLLAKCKPRRSGRLVLTDQQAVCGDPQLDFCDPLNWTSSAGYPYTAIKPAGVSDKKWLFDLEETPTGLHLKDYNEPLKSILLFKRRQREEGVIQPTIFTDCLKDARIAIEKCSKPGKTRIFSMSPVDYTIDFRRFFYDFISTYQSKRFSNYNMIGINVFGKEWDVLARKLLTYKDVCTGDYSNFGPGLNEEVAQACLDIILAWYDEFDPEQSLDDRRTRACLAAELIGSMHLCEDLVYRVVAGIPSGSPITVVLNSLVNTFYLFAAWDMLSVDWPVELQGFQNFDKNVVLYTYGDDFIFSISPVYKNLFNSKILSELFKKFDITLTDAFKGEEVTPYSSLEEATFLKGSFKYFLGQYWYGLDTDQIFDMANFVNSKHNTLELTLVNAEQSLLHAHGHGKEFFNVVKSRLGNAFKVIDVAFQGRTFEEITTLKRTVSDDPLYERALKYLLPLF
ncbi:hypothetical protein [Hubei picorna-like virus 29]|uniref:hypothetical protein n=1 Tax=Hubei picorna-like virus 29 TaxID=1923109 RepID=UPI000909ABE8|nr:hypothetical protein [Hubei picorna-like virus 29]APG76666.1 hypothetical protein [Hubei picorna-like virus 29]